MMCLVWALAMAVMVKVGDVNGQCWEQANCQDLSSETNILECIKLCRSDLNAETAIFPGEAHLQPPPSSDDPDSPLPALSPSSPISSSELPSQNQIGGSQAKRSYSMEHFRWGKPVGRKRRPIKVYTNGVEEESAVVSPNELRRDVDNEVTEEGEGAGGALYNLQEKKDGSYKMNHFRWSGPPASKRYGGFMKSWDERSQTPLLTLFKNVINKDAQQQ